MAFSDHFAHVVEFAVPFQMKTIFSPNQRPSLKIRPDVVKDSVFKERLRLSLQHWEQILEFSHQTHDQSNFLIRWWEILVKPGIRQIAINRTKELRDLNIQVLNFHLIRQAYLTRKLQQGRRDFLADLQQVHLQIEEWYLKESEKVQFMSKVNEFQFHEKTTLYHHELLQKVIKKVLNFEVGN